MLPTTLILTLGVCLTSATVVMDQSRDEPQGSHDCDLDGVWEVTKPGQNFSSYYRLTTTPTTILLQHQSESYELDRFAGKRHHSHEYKHVMELTKLKFMTQMVNIDSPNLCSEMNEIDGINWKKVDDIKKVHLIFMNHLDVGYNVNHFYPGTRIKIPGYVLNVLNWYFQVYFPRAAKLGDELRALRSNETFIYTTHPWLVNLYLDCPGWSFSGITLQCPSESQVDTFRRAVWMGDITWHAGPLNQEAEASNPELFSYSLSLSERLDQYFGITREARTLSQRDVPGMTRAVIPYLLAHNISALSVGVNGGSAPPDVPSPNIWKFGDHSILTYWHKGGYPLPAGKTTKNPGGLSRKDCQFVQGFNEVLCFAFRSDNLGPPENIAEIKQYYTILKYEFPGANIAATKFEDYTKLILPFRSKFPVVDKEIGDTWIQGPASDPIKMIKYRTINRLRSQCLKLKQCDVNDKRFDDFSRTLVKLPEHTYGLGSCFDNKDWLNTDFQPQQYLRESFRNNTRNYLGHRIFNDLAVQALKDHPLAKTIKTELLNLKPYLPKLHGYRQQPLDQVIQCKNGFKLKFGTHGGLVLLQDKNGNNWASEQSPLAQILYRTYDENDFKRQARIYNWKDNGAFWKFNYETAHPEAKFWSVNVNSLHVPFHGDICSQGIYIGLSHPNMTTWWKYGAPTQYFLKYRFDKDNLDIDYQFFNKPSTRMVEALFLSFKTPAKASYKWYVHKLGYLIDASNIVNNGSQYVHSVDFGTAYLDQNQKHGLFVESPDVATVVTLTKDRQADVLPVPLTPMTSQPNGMAFNIYNNVWETNFIFWYPYEPQDKHYKARFRISVV